MAQYSEIHCALHEPGSVEIRELGCRANRPQTSREFPELTDRAENDLYPGIFCEIDEPKVEHLCNQWLAGALWKALFAHQRCRSRPDAKEHARQRHLTERHCCGGTETLGRRRGYDALMMLGEVITREDLAEQGHLVRPESNRPRASRARLLPERLPTRTRA